MRLTRSASKILYPMALATGLLLASVGASPAAATVVRFTSVMGTFDVRMFNTATPLTVNNILNYVNNNHFNNSIVHRVDSTYSQQANGSFAFDPFVIQSGDVAFPPGGLLTQIQQFAAVQNEPGISNLRGTMALAKLSGQPNSGTNNWFINLDNNSFLDTNNGGFTVFGRVVGNGMDVVDAISRLGTFQISQAGTTVPLIGDVSGGITRDNFVIFSSVKVLNIPDGDYDFDGDVDGNDFLIWQTTRGSTTNVAADGNGNGVVDTADLNLWNTNYGTVMAPPITAVPEPGTLALVAAGLLFHWGARGRVRARR